MRTTPDYTRLVYMGLFCHTTVSSAWEWLDRGSDQAYSKFHEIGGCIMKTIYIDVMRNGFFVKTLPYKHHEVMKLDEEKLRAFVLQKLPTLKDKDFDLFYD